MAFAGGWDQMPSPFREIYEAVQQRLGGEVTVRDLRLDRDLTTLCDTLTVSLETRWGAYGEVTVALSSAVMQTDQIAEYVAEAVARQVGVEKPEPRQTEKLTEHIVGFRLWRIVDGDLWSLFRAGPKREWKRGAWVRGQCQMGFHPAPAPNCHCGWNAFHEPTGAINQYAGHTQEPGVVLGAIQAKGVIELHHDGFRAQWARPIALRGGSVAGVAEVETTEELIEFALEWGSPVPSEMRPAAVPALRDGGFTRYTSLGGGFYGGATAMAYPVASYMPQNLYTLRRI